jgi:hypothetical protein
MTPIRRLLLQHKPGSYSRDGATEAPLTIAPGKDGFVIPVIETGGPCRRHFAANSGESFDQVHLRYRYRGRDRTEWYSLPFTVTTVCGNPKLVIEQITSP